MSLSPPPLRRQVTGFFPPPDEDEPRNPVVSWLFETLSGAVEEEGVVGMDVDVPVATVVADEMVVVDAMPVASVIVIESDGEEYEFEDIPTDDETDSDEDDIDDDDMNHI